MRISDWSSDVCSSDLGGSRADLVLLRKQEPRVTSAVSSGSGLPLSQEHRSGRCCAALSPVLEARQGGRPGRSEEHTSELQSLMRISYADFCLQKKKTKKYKKK